MEPHQSKNKRGILISGMLLSATIALTMMLFTTALESRTPDNSLVDMLPENGTPTLMLQSKVGDDTLPHIHQTYCQILPYKRYIGDDQVFCYVEVITDWMVE